MKPIRITRHARNRMRWHRIGEDLIEKTLEVADWAEPSLGGRFNYWKRVGDRFLRVTVRDEPERIVVISAVFKRKPPKGRGQP